MSRKLLDAASADPSASASDEVLVAIAGIETQRRETENAAGFAMSRSSALHRLNELLAHETEGLRLRGPDSAHRGNIQVLSAEIARVRGLSDGSGLGARAPNGDATRPARGNSRPGNRRA